ncbi:hypothetical protein Tsubulata_005459, partial [Turnera subulata]
MDIDPPLKETYNSLLHKSSPPLRGEDKSTTTTAAAAATLIEECELPLIDLSLLGHGSSWEMRDKCMEDIRQASSEWGFFQVVNHGIPRQLLDRMQDLQVKVFQQPFNTKATHKKLNCYRWGNPKATSSNQFSWSEAFHIPLTDVPGLMVEYHNLREIIEEYATRAAKLATDLAEILAQDLGVKSTFFQTNCSPTTSYLRMNRYPLCPISSHQVVFGLMPHTDSDFLTIVHQDQIGGLQLRKNGAWLNVNPIPKALIINIGDLFQALSHGVYKSIEHRVIAPREVERHSLAYFYCPSYDTVIESSVKPAIYRKFSYGEYMQQKQKDVEASGEKVGLS